MNVAELREALASMPDHWPVHIEVHTNSLGQLDACGLQEFLFTLDCIPSSFPARGSMAVIRLNHEPE